MSKFYDTSIKSGLIKDILRNVPLPTLRTVQKGDFIVKDCFYIKDNDIIKCTKTGFIDATAVASTVVKNVISQDSLDNLLKEKYGTKQGSALFLDDVKDKVIVYSNTSSYNIREYGKNIFNPTLETLTINGVTITKNDDGTYTLNGTPTSGFKISLGLVRLIPNALKDENNLKVYYKLTGAPECSIGVEDADLQGYDNSDIADLQGYDGAELVDLQGKYYFDIVELEIISDPQDQSESENNTALFSVVAQGSILSYRWQYQTRTSTTAWNNISGTGSNPITGFLTDTVSVPATSARNGYKYRCIVTDIYGNSLTSNYATLTVT